METVGEAASEFRANLMDCLSYLVPGGLLLLVAYAVAEASGGWATRLLSCCQATLGRLGLSAATFWLGAVFALTLLAIAYASGAVLHVVDKALSPKWTVHLAKALEESPTLVVKVRDAVAQHFAWHLQEGAAQGAPPTRADQELHNLAQAVVAQEGGGTQSLVERYEALADFHGHLAWVILAGGLGLPAVFSNGGLMLWVTWGLGVAALLAYHRVQTSPGTQGAARHVWILVFVLSLVLFGLGALGSPGRHVSLMLAPALTAIAYLGLKKRQCAILVMRVKFIWNGALLRLQGKQASAAGM